MKQIVKRLLGEWLLGVLDYYRFPQWRASWGGALNGQYHRRRIVQALIQELPLDAVVETGTYRGTTTAYFASLTYLPIYTVEHNKRAQGFDYAALRRFRNVRRYGGDSREFLRRLSAEPVLYEKTIFFYLDAHWDDDLPLSEELPIIFGTWRRAIVMIDDFQVPDDPGYGYDNYGASKALDFTYIQPIVERFGLRTFYPALSSAAETGKKRGSVILVRDPAIIHALRAMHEVRELVCDALSQNSRIA